MKKKLLAFSLAAVMVVSAAGCSSKKKETEAPATEAKTEAQTEAKTEAKTEAVTEAVTEALEDLEGHAIHAAPKRRPIQ